MKIPFLNKKKPIVVEKPQLKIGKTIQPDKQYSFNDVFVTNIHERLYKPYQNAKI